MWAVSGIKPPDYSLGVCLRLQADGGWTLVAGTLDTANPDKIWYE